MAGGGSNQYVIQHSCNQAEGDCDLPVPVHLQTAVGAFLADCECGLERLLTEKRAF